MLKNSSMSSHLELCLHHYLVQLQHNIFVYKLKWCLKFLLIFLPFVHNKHLIWWPLASKWSFSAPKCLYTTKKWLIISGNVIFTIYSYVLHNFENFVFVIPRCENRWSFDAQKKTLLMKISRLLALFLNHWFFTSGFWSLTYLRHVATVDTKSITKKIIFYSKLAPIWYIWNFKVLDSHFLPIQRPVWIFWSTWPVELDFQNSELFFDNFFCKFLQELKYMYLRPATLQKIISFPGVF